MRKASRLVLAGLLAVGLAVPVAGAANAAAGDCSLGWTCAWDNNDFKGTSWASQKPKYDWGHVGFANKADSVSSNGASCKYTQHYDNWGFWDSNPSGLLFTMYSRTLMGSNWKDPKLSNGAGFDGVGKKLNDRVNAHVFTGC